MTSSECLQKHMRMPGQLQYLFTSHYFLFLPNLLTFRTKVSLELHLSHYGPYIQTMCSSMLDDYLNKDTITPANWCNNKLQHFEVFHIRMTLLLGWSSLEKDINNLPLQTQLFQDKLKRATDFWITIYCIVCEAWQTIQAAAHRDTRSTASESNLVFMRLCIRSVWRSFCYSKQCTDNGN